MSLNGQASTITIKDERNSNDIRKFSNVKLQLITNNQKLIVKVPPDNEVVCECYLKDCSYMPDSSIAGTVECIRIDSERKTLIIIDNKKQSEELLKYMRDYLTNKPSDADIEELVLIDNEKVNQLIKALNDRKATEAAQLAGQLARDKASIRFGLDMVDESGNAAPPPPPQPIEEPLKIKLSIESYLINHCTDEQFDVAVLPGTNLQDLKQMVRDNVGIESNLQYWYINREHLADNYIFGVSVPRINENTILILYIAKPQNN